MGPVSGGRESGECGEIVTAEFDYDGGRAVSVFVPSGTATAAVWAGDGELITSWGALLAEAGIDDVAIIGAHRSSDADEMVRIREYSPTVAPEIFRAHQEFLLGDVAMWVETQLRLVFSRDRTMVCGVSASAELALAMGLGHPAMFGHVFAASPGGGFVPPTSDEGWPAQLPRCYLTAGTGEPWFADNARRWVDAALARGAEVVFTQPAGEHGDPFWAEEFVRWVASACADRHPLR